MWSEESKRKAILKKDEIIKLAAEYCRWLDVEKKGEILNAKLEISVKENPEESDGYIFTVIAKRIFLYGDGRNRVVGAALIRTWDKENSLMVANEGGEENFKMIDYLKLKDYTAEMRELINKLK